MAASDPLGGNQFWSNGAPVTALRKTGNETGDLKFWSDGAPVAWLLPASQAGNPVGSMTVRYVHEFLIDKTGV